MNCYSLNENDRPRHSWALITEEKKTRKPIRPPEISPTVRQLLGQPIPSGLRFKPQYSGYRCKSCRRFDGYAVFDEGFDDDVKIRIKGDFGHTTDRIFVVNDRFVHAIQSVDAKGYELKPLGKSGWHALRVNCFVEIAPGVIKVTNVSCSDCGRANEAWGLVQRISEVQIPPTKMSFFASSKSMPYMFLDREIFVTEDLLMALKSNGIKGGYALRLFTDEEWAKLKVNPAGVVDDRPRGSTVYL